MEVQTEKSVYLVPMIGLGLVYSNDEIIHNIEGLPECSSTFSVETVVYVLFFVAFKVTRTTKVNFVL